MAWWETRLGQAGNNIDDTNSDTWWAKRYNARIIDTKPEAAIPAPTVEVAKTPAPEQAPAKQSNIFDRIKQAGSQSFDAIKSVFTSEKEDQYKGETYKKTDTPILRNIESILNNTLVRSFEDKTYKGEDNAAKTIQEALDLPVTDLKSLGKKYMVTDKYARERSYDVYSAAAGNFASSLIDTLTVVYEGLATSPEAKASGWEQYWATNNAKKNGTTVEEERAKLGIVKGVQEAQLSEAELQNIPTRKISNDLKLWIHETSPANPTFAEQLESGGVSMAGFMAITLATGGGAGTMAIVESSMEAANVYEELRQTGKTPEEANFTANKALAANLVISYLTDKFGIFSEAKQKKIFKAILSSAGEGIQESLQQVISNVSTGKPWFEGVAESGIIGGILGGGTSLVMPNGEIVDIQEDTGKISGKDEPEVKVQRETIKPEGLPASVTGASISIRPNGTASYNLEVSEDARGQGVGTEAVQKIEAEILDRGISKVELPVKEESVGFFEKLGYKTTGEVKSGLVQMNKTLVKQEVVPKVEADLEMSAEEFVKSKISNNSKLNKVNSFTTEEGNFSTYDIEKTAPRDRAAMFTVYEGKDGYIIRNAILPENARRKGIATEFYKKINEESIKKTGKPLRSTQSRIIKLSNGKTEILHELSDDAVALWDSFVNNGIAKKIDNKNYAFKTKSQLTDIRNKTNSKVEEKLLKVDEKGKVKVNDVLNLLDKNVKTEDKAMVRTARETVDNVNSDLDTIDAAIKTVRDAGYENYARFLEHLDARIYDVKISDKYRNELTSGSKTVTQSTQDNMDAEMEAVLTEAASEEAQYKLNGINTKDVATLKRMYARSENFQGGDIETIRDHSEKSRDLLERVIENVREMNPNKDLTDEEALDFALSLPTKSKIVASATRQAATPAVKGSPKGSVNADVGGYANRDIQLQRMFGESYKSIKPVEMPELVQLSKEFMGHAPTVKEFRKNALGYAKVGALTGYDIILRPDIFRRDFDGSFYDKSGLQEDLVLEDKPMDQRIARLVLAHELGHIVDSMPDGSFARGNELGRIATLNKFLQGSFSDPETQTKIDGLTTELKKVQAERRLLREPVLDEVGVTVVVNNRPQYTVTNKILDRVLLRQVRDINQKIEALQENAIKQSEIRQELKDWTQYWKPFDEGAVSEQFMKYRYSSAEMYADALSGLFNDPMTLKEKAPKFFDAFFRYLDNKPQVEKAFSGLQDLLNAEGDALYARRDQFINQAYEDAEAKFTAKELEKAQRKSNLWMDLRILLDSKNAYVYNKVNKTIKSGKSVLDAKNPIYLLEETQYMEAFVKNKIEDWYQPVKDLAETVPNGWNEFGKMLQLSRALTERGDMANPGGYDPKTATDQLGYMERNMPAKDWKALKEAQELFRKANQEVIAFAEEHKFWNPETIESMKANKDYATFQVIDYLDTYITPNVKQAHGTLKDIANPATTTVMKTINIIMAAERNSAKRETIDFFLKFHKGDLEKAPSKWNGKYNEVTSKAKPDTEIVKLVRDGKIEGYYVDPYIARSLNSMNNATLNTVAKIIRVISGAEFYRPLFTSINLGFQTYNFTKDFLTYWKQLPDKNLGEALRSFPQAVKQYAGAVKPAWASATDQRNELIREMENMKILGLNRNDVYKSADPEDAQIQRTLRRLGLGKAVKERNFFVKKWIALNDGLSLLGNFIERLPKVAGYQQQKGQLAEKELGHFVRTRAGSPNFREAGVITPITNSAFLFSNAIKEGVKTGINTATDPKTRSGYWWKTFMVNVLPKMLMVMAAYGVFGDRLKDGMEDASEYDKTNYTVIPMGTDENGKTIYFRIPQDESGRLVSAIVWKMLNAGNRDELKISDLAEVFSIYAGNIPGLAPSFETYSAISQYLSGRNPYDAFRGTNMIPDKEFGAGTKYSLPIFVNKLIQMNGGGIIVPSYKPKDTDMTMLQKILTLPVASNILGRWVKVSDYGQTEKLRDITDSVAARKNAESIERERIVEQAFSDYKKSDRSDIAYNNVVSKMVENQFNKPVDQLDKDEIAQANNMIKSLYRNIKIGQADPKVNALIYATSNDAKAELLVPILSGMKKQEVTDFLIEMIDEKIITVDVMEKYSKLKR